MQKFKQGKISKTDLERQEEKVSESVNIGQAHHKSRQEEIATEILENGQISSSICWKKQKKKV